MRARVPGASFLICPGILNDTDRGKGGKLTRPRGPGKGLGARATFAAFHLHPWVTGAGEVSLLGNRGRFGFVLCVGCAGSFLPGR